MTAGGTLTRSNGHSGASRAMGLARILLALQTNILENQDLPFLTPLPKNKIPTNIPPQKHVHENVVLGKAKGTFQLTKLADNCTLLHG